jgi:uncharacterized protein (TIGR02284 family)
MQMKSVNPSAVMADDEVVDILNDLVETSKDGEYGFRVCAEHCKSPDLKTVFERHSAECRRAAEELQTLVGEYGGRPETSGTVSGAMHRGWLAVRGTMALNDDLSMLEESERGEDTARDRYRRALKKELPPSVLAVVQRQAEGVQRNHGDIKRLRDQMRAASK